MNFYLSAFADEYSPSLSGQIEGLNKHGIGFMEIRGVDGKNVAALTVEEAREIRAKLDAGGVHVSSIGSPFGKIGIKDDFAPHLENMKRTMEVAHVLGTDKMRIFSFFMPKGEDPANYRSEVLDRMEQMLLAADKANIILCHENEKDIYGDSPERCLDINEYFANRIKLIFDPANFINCGYKPYEDGFSILGDRIYYMHIKDASDGNTIVPAGCGIGRIPEILAKLAEGNRDMYTTLEPHLKVFAGLKDLENGENTTHIVDTYATSADAFAAATNALKGIVDGLK